MTLTVPTFRLFRIFPASEAGTFERFKVVEPLWLLSIHLADLSVYVLRHFGYEAQNMHEHHAGDFVSFLPPCSILLVKLWHLQWFWLPDGSEHR